MVSDLSEELEINAGTHQGSVLSPFFAVVVDTVTEFARDGTLSESLYVENLVQMSDTIEGLWDKF